MNMITFLSNLIIPIIIFYIIGYGLLCKTDIFDAFVKGAGDGLRISLLYPTRGVFARWLRKF